jgi:hypothetical protein
MNYGRRYSLDWWVSLPDERWSLAFAAILGVGTWIAFERWGWSDSVVISALVASSRLGVACGLGMAREQREQETGNT